MTFVVPTKFRVSLSASTKIKLKKKREREREKFWGEFFFLFYWDYDDYIDSFGEN